MAGMTRCGEDERARNLTTKKIAYLGCRRLLNNLAPLEPMTQRSAFQGHRASALLGLHRHDQD